MDTLCLPRRPLELRRKALITLNEPFEYATHVLVLDIYLRRLCVETMGSVEILARISSSRWTQPLWMFIEGPAACIHSQKQRDFPQGYMLEALKAFLACWNVQEH